MKMNLNSILLKKFCVCVKARDNSKPLGRSVYYVPSCSSVKIKAKKHDFTWEVICNPIASVDSPGDITQTIIDGYGT